MERVDVAIVGGGPAGCAAAEAAASNGADALAIEKGVPRSDRDGPGPDSTDAAGMLDYWVDILGIPFEEIPDEIVLQELNRAEFIGPTEAVSLSSTGIEASYPKFGFAFHRAWMDDWLRERAEEAGAEYRVGSSVRTVETDLDADAGSRHHLTLADGSEIETDHLVLADGPQRTITIGALDQFMPDGRSVAEAIGPDRANHIAYQEHRRFPEEVFEPDVLKFWWGNIPGKTAYPWVFPNDGTVARVGLTMPIGMDLTDVRNREDYRLLREEDETIPSGAVYLRRLLEAEYGDEYDIEEDFPLVEDRGKNRGVEAYPISSTRPIDSPTGAGIAVAGGAMGTTSAFHEGGYHVAVATGRIAGELAATDELERYNDAWKETIGEEILRNVAMADVVAKYEPDDWDRTFRTVRGMLEDGEVSGLLNRASAGVSAMRLGASYKRAKRRYRSGKYVQLTESEYDI